MNKWFVWAVWLAYFLSCPWTADAGSRDKKKKRVPEVKVEQSDYDKLFKGKRYDTAISEFMAVHKMDGKVYMEYPLRLMGRNCCLLRQPRLPRIIPCVRMVIKKIRLCISGSC